MKPGKLRNEYAAKKVRDTIALHQVALDRDEILRGRYIAVKIIDGGSDNTAYDTRDDAYRHHLYSTDYAYLQIPLERWSEYVCDWALWYTATRYKAGFKPEPHLALIMPLRMEDSR